MAVRIPPSGKLGTVRIDRTIDVYSTPTNYQEDLLNIEDSRKNFEQSTDEDLSDIAVIYSLVRRASTRRASAARLSVLPLNNAIDQTSALTVKSYTFQGPPAPIHREKPIVSRTPRRSVIERQISQITERVSQLHDSFLSHLSNATTTSAKAAARRQRNRSHSTFQESPSLKEFRSDFSRFHSVKRRPKSEIFNEGNLSGRKLLSSRIRSDFDICSMISGIPMSTVCFFFSLVCRSVETNKSNVSFFLDREEKRRAIFSIDFPFFFFLVLIL